MAFSLLFHIEEKLLQARKENILFNDTLNTFYLWVYGVRHMVKDHSDRKRGKPLAGTRNRSDDASHHE